MAEAWIKDVSELREGDVVKAYSDAYGVLVERDTLTIKCTESSDDYITFEPTGDGSIMITAVEGRRWDDDRKIVIYTTKAELEKAVSGL